MEINPSLFFSHNGSQSLALDRTAVLRYHLTIYMTASLRALALIITGHRPHRFHYFIYFEVGENWGGFEVGAFFVVNKGAGLSIKQHEAGHGLQNIILGVFMPFLVSIPSVARYWYREFEYRRGRGDCLPPYDAIWFEGWATRLGKKYYK